MEGRRTTATNAEGHGRLNQSQSAESEIGRKADGYPAVECRGTGPAFSRNLLIAVAELHKDAIP